MIDDPKRPDETALKRYGGPGSGLGDVLDYHHRPWDFTWFHIDRTLANFCRSLCSVSRGVPRDRGDNGRRGHGH